MEKSQYTQVRKILGFWNFQQSMQLLTFSVFEDSDAENEAKNFLNHKIYFKK